VIYTVTGTLASATLLLAVFGYYMTIRSAIG